MDVFFSMPRTTLKLFAGPAHAAIYYIDLNQPFRNAERAIHDTIQCDSKEISISKR